MIILASSIILTLNNSGIINKANEAEEKTDLAQVKNLATLIWSEAYLNENIITPEDYEKYVEDGLKDAGIITDDYKITATEKGVDVEINWVVATVDEVPIPKGFVASEAKGENTKEGGLVIYEGTVAVTDANVEEAKRTRNQYVWVPVASEDFTTQFVRQNFGNSDTIIANEFGLERQYWEVLLDVTTNMPLSQQNSNYVTSATLAEVQAMYASVKEYEGFYIARYEAGIDTQRTNENYKDEEGNIILAPKVYSMMGKKPYTHIPWAKNNAINEDTGGAVQVARNIYPATNLDYGVVSTLTYGVQWDATLQWWLDTNAVSSVRESTSYGNHLDHVINSAEDLNDGAMVALYDRWEQILEPYTPKGELEYYPKDSEEMWILSTGALKVANKNNIYDMAGNLPEWTMEGRSSSERVTRGGGAFTNSSIKYAAVCQRSYSRISESWVETGFRPALYIK